MKMGERVTWRVTMELLSDTILGSGISVPGGEDIAVCKDDKGFPYMKGSTFKGLLRESLKNLLVWTGGDKADLDAICGVSGWKGTADDRRLQLTGLCLDPCPAVPEDCYDSRMLTSLEDGVVKEGTLRMASCVRSGMFFSGTLTCCGRDVALIEQALLGIKWVGTMRSRGFGSVRFSMGDPVKQASPVLEEVAACIHYQLETKSPILITDDNHSKDNSYATRNYIPGAAVRGMVISWLAEHRPEWFEAHRIGLLCETTRFLDAVPCHGKSGCLPGIMGFYAEKGKNDLVSVLNSDVAGMKRASLGDCCILEGERVLGWRSSTGGDLRILRRASGREETKPFQTRHIKEGQFFEGYILLDDPKLSAGIAAAFERIVWIGADRYEGYGQCAVTQLEAAACPDWYTYGYQEEDTPSSTIYLLALSPITMLDAWGEPCGLNLDVLAKRLGVERVEIEACSTSQQAFGGFNRTWQCGVPSVRVYDRGSIFKLHITPAPTAKALRQVQNTGLGIRRAEGFGQVLLLRKELYEQVQCRAEMQKEMGDQTVQQAALRRAKYCWVMEQSAKVYKDGLSRSQLGDIQSLCEKAIACGGDTRELMEHLQHNRSGRGAEHGSRFRNIASLIEKVLEQPLSCTLGEPCQQTVTEKLRLLCLLFDYSRKGDAG